MMKTKVMMATFVRFPVCQTRCLHYKYILCVSSSSQLCAADIAVITLKMRKWRLRATNKLVRAKRSQI